MAVTSRLSQDSLLVSSHTALVCSHTELAKMVIEVAVLQNIRPEGRLQSSPGAFSTLSLKWEQDRKAVVERQACESGENGSPSNRLTQ